MKSKRKFYSKLNNPLTNVGIVVVFIIVTWGIFAPWLSKYSFELVSGLDKSVEAYAPPSDLHIFGTTKFGRDVLGRLIWGARASLSIGLVAIVISSVFGTLLGIISAYYGGILDSIIMRLVDIIMAFPTLVVIMLIVSIYGNDMSYIMLIAGIMGIVGYIRLIRGNVLQEKSKTYIEAAKVAGSRDWKIMFSHILPNCIAPVIVAVSFSLGGMILSLAGLSFLGFGDSRLVEWGTDINLGQSQIEYAPWAIFWQGFAIFLTVLRFMLLGDGLRDALDPRLQAKA